MKTKNITILIACIFLTGLISLTSVSLSAEINTSDEIKRFNTMSDEEKDKWLKAYPQLKSSAEEMETPLQTDQLSSEKEEQ